MGTDAVEAVAVGDEYDVVILGGGLAGLTLAIQLVDSRPATRVLVAEKRPGDPREAAFKVGESTGEVAGFYFGTVIGMEDHLESAQMAKRGLKWYLPAGDNRDLGRRVEVTTQPNPKVPTFQLDRGRFEVALHRRAVEVGADVGRGWRVTDLTIANDGPHRVTLLRDDDQRTVETRWLVDATGRAGLVKRQLGLARPVDHHVNAAWLRLDGGLDIESFCDDPQWLARAERGNRQRATAHLMGEGYWVWLIQLASGPISIGIVADAEIHPFETFNTLETALGWFGRYEPLLGAEIAGRQDQVVDFLVVGDFAYDCERVFSPARWCLTGEAGVFADPLYSPGSNFIAIANTLITDMVGKDLDGTELGDLVELYNAYYLAMFRGLLSTFSHQYELFGNPQVLAAKLAWDPFPFWLVAAPLFMQRQTTNRPILEKGLGFLAQSGPLMGRVQAFLREWHSLDNVPHSDEFVDLFDRFPYMRQRRDNLAASYDDEELLAHMERNILDLRAQAVQLFHLAAQRVLDDPPDEATPINPAAIGLDPSRWEADGLFSGETMSLEEAVELAPGMLNLRLDAPKPSR